MLGFTELGTNFLNLIGFGKTLKLQQQAMK
jgi:hypothetical protein